MGGKHARKREHLQLYFAEITLLTHRIHHPNQ